MTSSTKISSTALPISRKQVYLQQHSKSDNTSLTRSNLKEVFGPAKKNKHQGMEKKVLDELVKIWENTQTSDKRHRLLLGPSFPEVNFKKPQ